VEGLVVRALRLLPFGIVVGLLTFSLTSPFVLAQQHTCEGARIVIEGGLSPFVLPDDSGKTLTVAADSLLHILGEDTSPDSTVRWSVLGVGPLLPAYTSDLASGEAQIDVSDYSSYVRGLYDVEGMLLDGQDEVCTISFRVAVRGFGGVVGTAAAALTGVLGIGVLVSIPFTAKGTRVKIELDIQLRRRRRRGWRRFIPVIAWKPTLTSTLIGALTGLCGAALLQQGSVVSLSLVNAIWGIVIGGGVTFGVVCSVSSILTFLQSLQDTSEESQ
jgi:hypothetical protein